MRFLVALLLAISASWAGDVNDPAGTAEKVSPPKKVTYLGVYLAPVDEVLAKHLQMQAGVGLVVRSISKDSPAAKAKLQRHDILIRFDDQLLVNTDQLATLVRLKKAGDKVKLKIRRAGQEMSLEAVLDSRVEPERRHIWRYVPGEPGTNSWKPVKPDGSGFKVDAMINKLFGDKELDDKEKAGKINELLKKYGLGSATITINGNRIELKPPDKIDTKNLEETIRKALELLPEATRKMMEQKLKDKDGNFKKNVRILETPNGPMFIIESMSIRTGSTEGEKKK